MHGWVLVTHAVFHNTPLQFSSCILYSTMHGCSPRHDAVFHNERLSSRHARCVPHCTIEFSFQNAKLQFSSWCCIPQCMVEFSSCTLCSTMHGWVLDPHYTFAVLVMHALFHNRPFKFSSFTLHSTMHGCSSRHARCVPQCTVAVLVMTLCSTMNGCVLVMQARTVAVLIMTLCSTMHGWVLVMHAVSHNAWLSSQSTLQGYSSRPARCVPQCTVAVLVMTLCSTMNDWVLVMHARTVAVLIMTLFSTVHGWLLDPHYTVAFLIMHAVFHSSRL